MKHFPKYCFILISLLLCMFFISDNIKLQAADSSESMPEKYSLYGSDLSLADDVCNQGNYNTCWAYSALGSIQTQLKKKEINDTLSPFYLAYTAYYDGIEHHFPINTQIERSKLDRSFPFYQGGTSSIAAALIMSWRGVTFEKNLCNDPVENTDPVTIASYIQRYNLLHSVDTPQYIINDIYNLTPWVSEKKKYDKEYIKEFIFGGNSVSSTCSLNPAFLNDETSSLYNGRDQYREDGTDKYYHSILIVGWDDNYSKENFIQTCRPESNGAWLVKNSYGKEFGTSGFFWISYEDNTLLESVVYSSLTDNPYKHNYQYDYFGWTTSLYTITKETKDSRIYSTGLMANIFRAKDDEYISAVSICTLDENAQYEITVYPKITDRSKPDSGTPSSVTSGCEKYPGYHIITLDEKIRVRQADYFSVVVKIYNPQTNFTIPIEAAIVADRDIDDSLHILNVPSLDKEISYNESFLYYRDGWCNIMPQNCDAVSECNKISKNFPFPYLSRGIRPQYMAWGNVCVKAFSTEYTPVQFDADDDGVVNSHDLVFVKQNILSGSLISDGSENRFCDFDNDNKVTSCDLMILINTLLEQ